jgi:hypothetical protein
MTRAIYFTLNSSGLATSVIITMFPWLAFCTSHRLSWTLSALKYKGEFL